MALCFKVTWGKQMRTQRMSLVIVALNGLKGSCSYRGLKHIVFFLFHSPPTPLFFFFYYDLLTEHSEGQDKYFTIGPGLRGYIRCQKSSDEIDNAYLGILLEATLNPRKWQGLPRSLIWQVRFTCSLNVARLAYSHRVCQCQHCCMHFV